ncbi:MAG: hypothetical protein GAK40_01315 [Burkholderia plantarii]|nr:MAG: hypothetical protein GAK40_01315 [Burkholderia plantarii]
MRRHAYEGIDSRPVDRYVTNLLKERRDFEEQIQRLREAYCEATLELRALKRQRGDTCFDGDTLTERDYRQDLIRS